MSATLSLAAGGGLLAFVWGSTPVVQKHMMGTVAPETLLVLTGAMYAAAVLAYTACRWRALSADVRANVRPPQLALLAGMALLGGLLGNLLYLRLIRAHGSYAATALVSAAPLVTLALAVVALRERVTPAQALGGALIVAGAVLVAAA